MSTSGGVETCASVGDGRRTRLEDTLDDVFLGIVALGAAKKQKADEERAEAERKAEQERQRLERERQARMSAARDKDILDRAQARDKAMAVHSLIAAVKQAAAADSGKTPEPEQWLERADAVAASLDPLAGELSRMLASHESAAGEAGKPPPLTNRWGH